MINILLIGVFEGLFLAALLYSKKKRNVSDFILASFFLVFAITILLSYVEAFNRQNGFPYPAFIFTAPPFLLLHGPILWLYIKSLTEQYFKFKPIYLLTFLPFIAMVIDQSLTVYILPVPQKIDYILSETFKKTISYPFFLLLIALTPIFFFSLGIQLIKRYKSKIESYFSQTSDIDLKWLYIILVSWITLCILINLFFIVDLFYPIAPFGLMQYISFIIAAIYVVLIGFYGLKQDNIFITRNISLNLEKNLFAADNYSKPLKQDEKEFINFLLKYMSDKKPYLQPEITVKSLSDELNVTSEYLSEVINNDLNKNFFDFINYYRIEEFKNQCKDEANKHLNIIGIAFNCGFNSKATFNRVFKKSTGLTPSEYMKMSQ